MDVPPLAIAVRSGIVLRPVIDQLRSRLPSDFCEIDQLAAVLLRFCREQIGVLRAAYDSDQVCALIGEESDAVQAWLEREIEEDWLDDDELAAFGGILERVAARASALRVAPDQAAVIAARVAAQALDRSHGHRFAGVFRGRGVVDVAAGDPIPICRPPLKEIFARQLSSNPDRLGEQLHELTWLRLMPPLERGHEVRLSFEYEHVLADVDANTRLGVAIPSDVLSDLRFDVSETAEPRFFHVRPKRTAEQQAVILRLLDEADAAGARVVLLPELCVDEDIVAAIRDWFAKPERAVAILICGSMHTVRDGKQRNVSTILTAGGGMVEHFKFNPFSLALPTGDGEVALHREDIVTTPSLITVLMCGDWSFTSLICKDFLEPGVDRALQQLGVRIVLVPACSPKTSIFEPIAAILAARNQALVLVGNLADPGPSEVASVLVARPTQDLSVERVLRSEIVTPCLHFVDFGGSQRLDS